MHNQVYYAHRAIMPLLIEHNWFHFVSSRNGTNPINLIEFLVHDQIILK